MNEKNYMRLAISLAINGAGRTSPNPLVGAVIVKDGRIIGSGWHEKYGSLHAERNALANCSEDPKGAAIYVTLEPCCHYGKTPPCTDAIIESGIIRVVIGSRDPNPLVSGKGVQKLREAGIEVVTDFMKEECDAVNPVFFHFITSRTPYVIMKYAMTMDGKIACFTGQSRWITGEAARRRVHEDRNRYSAVMAGVGTVIKDDPLLTCRIEGGRNPIRIICDTCLSTPPSSNIVQTASDVRTIIATCCTDTSQQAIYQNAGCEIIETEKDPATGMVDLRALMTKLGSMNIDSVIVEGGGTLNWSALSAGIVNKVQAYIAPKIFGGASALSPVSGTGVETPFQAFMLENSVITRIDDDFIIESEVSKCLRE